MRFHTRTSHNVGNGVGAWVGLSAVHSDTFFDTTKFIFASNKLSRLKAKLWHCVISFFNIAVF